MKIAFLLPNYSGRVVGSLLVYYNFANFLASRGHEVDLYHPLATGDERLSLARRVRILVSVALKNVRKNPVRWMSFPEKARPRFRFELRGLDAPHDLVVAFSWRAVEALEKVRTRGKVFGYIVEYESWAEANEHFRARMEKAYRTGIPLLSSSNAVDGMLETVGAKDHHLCVHGIDTDRSKATRILPPRERDARRVGFPVRLEPVKSPEVLAEAVRLLKARHGDGVVVWGFGSPDVPTDLRSLFDEYHVQPSDHELADLYETSAIFAVPSRKEGFGMPAAEAMAHGCAVVSTDNGGVRTFGTPGRNCLIVPAEDPTALADAIGVLLRDQGTRLALAEGAPESVSFLDWKLANLRFLERLGL